MKKHNARLVNGESLLTDTQTKKKKKSKLKDVPYKSSLYKCLHCTKPASECKGNCK